MLRNRAPIVGCAALALLVLGLWGFPKFWYTRVGAGDKLVWLSERTNVVGWTFRGIPVSESAERLLVADQTVNGEFAEQGGRSVVRVFSAKRYSAKPHDIGLFVHTPDRCWTQGGWKFEAVVPDAVQLTIHGVPMVFERRVFLAGGKRELVYFGGLVGGQPLPYRLDHNLSVGMKYAVNQAAKSSGGYGAGLRAVDSLFWRRIWDAFTARRQILGPKQFIRLSTPVLGSDLGAGDKQLQEFLGKWLAPEDFEDELKAWQSRKT